MIPQLYGTLSLSNGSYSVYPKGLLTHCSKCEVKEVRNGSYTLNLITNVNEECIDDILSQRIIGAKPNPTDPIQYFEIQKTTRSIDGKIKVEAKHVNNLCYQICSEGDTYPTDTTITYTGTPKEVWDRLVDQYIIDPVPFYFNSAISSQKACYLGFNEAVTLGDIMGGREGSFIDMWSGSEYHWDNFHCTLLASRGTNTHYKLKYWKNISSADQSESCLSTYSHILPYGIATFGEIRKNFTADRIAIPNTESVMNKTFLLDCTSVLDSYPITVGNWSTYVAARNAMMEYAQNYANVNGIGNIEVNIKIDFRGTLDEMSQIGLCDKVDIVLDNFGTTVTAKIVEATYDVLLERWQKLVVGQPTITMADLLLNKRRFNLR